MVSVNNAFRHLYRRRRSMRITCRASNGVTMKSRRMVHCYRCLHSIYTGCARSRAIGGGTRRVVRFLHCRGIRNRTRGHSILFVGNAVHQRRTHTNTHCDKVGDSSRVRFLSLPFCRAKLIGGGSLDRTSVTVIGGLLASIGPSRVFMTNSLTSPRKARHMYLGTILTTVSRLGSRR